MKKKSMITMIVIALMLVLSLTVLSACGKNKDDPPAQYSVTVTNGTGGGEYAEGATVKIKANAPETGKEFTSWTIEGVTVDDKTKAEITFTMPANAVTATANYGDVLYEFALENCMADKETAKFGEEVTFTADEVIGKRFESWNIKGVDDLTGLDLTKSPLTITMPANDINVAAVLEDIDYTVTVTGGTADKTTAHYGDSITITANAPETGKRFTGWTLEGVTVENTSVDELTFTMPAGNVTATANYEFIDYTVTVNGGTANKTTAHYGDKVTITADDKTEIGQTFSRWEINMGLDSSGLELSNSELTFTMPAGDVKLTSIYIYNQYSITVEGGTSSPTKENYGKEVTIEATVPTGQQFVKWTSKDGVAFADEMNAKTTFTMPAKNVTVTAVFEYIDYTVTVTGGMAKVNGGVASASVKAHYFDSITITAAAPETGKRFTGWTLEGVRVYDKTKAEITFTMPANAVTATANYDFEDYEIKVTGGTAQVNGGGVNDTLVAHYGDTVKIKAFTPETGKRFTSWTIEGVTVGNTSVTELTFTMPAGNVTATANYEFIDYDITVTGGTANKTTAHYGETVTITANAPETGKQFTGWTLTGVTVGDKTKAEITFKMPANNVTATAVFEDIDYRVTVEGGTADKSTAHYGEKVKITADAPEKGKEFVMWSFEGLVPDGLTLTDAELTFTMPTNAVTATAVFEDIDYEVKVICHNIETKTAHYGEEVTITAENIEGKIFVCWGFTNLDTEGLDLTRAELSFTMPANNVTAKAIYEELITLTFEGTTAQSEELQYKDNDSKSFRLPLGSGQDLCTYTIELSNSAFTFKVYGSDGVEIEPYDNGDGFMCIDIEREDNYTIRVVNTGSAANCTLTVTQI